MSQSIAQSTRHNSRLRLGEAAVLPVPQAIALLPLADKEARDWLEENQLILHLRGRRVVIWGDVLRQLKSSDQASFSRHQSPRPTTTFPRTNLRGDS